MKFALLFASVSAITLVKNSPDSENDPTHTYSIRVNDAHQAIRDKSGKDQAHFDRVQEEQEKADAWRGKYNGEYDPTPKK